MRAAQQSASKSCVSINHSYLEAAIALFCIDLELQSGGGRRWTFNLLGSPNEGMWVEV